MKPFIPCLSKWECQQLPKMGYRGWHQFTKSSPFAPVCMRYRTNVYRLSLYPKCMINNNIIELAAITVTWTRPCRCAESGENGRQGRVDIPQWQAPPTNPPTILLPVHQAPGHCHADTEEAPRCLQADQGTHAAAMHQLCNYGIP